VSPCALPAVSRRYDIVNSVSQISVKGTIPVHRTESKYIHRT